MVLEAVNQKENFAIDLGKLIATLFIIMIHCSPFAEETPLVFRGVFGG